MNWPALTENPLSAHQVAEITKATSGGNLAILGGSPGTGKTFSAAQIIRAIGEEIGYAHIAIAAPTGKAAVRCNESMGVYNLPVKARTWHSTLKVLTSDNGGWSFEYGRNKRLPFSVLIGDESSMLDVDMSASIFAARARGTKVLLIGDVNQLPPVGHGAPLRDLIAAGIPYGELREIRRNSGGIVQACADIRDGRPFACEGNLRLVPASGDEDHQDKMVETIHEAAAAFGVDAVWDVQVLTAVNKLGELSRRKLSKMLQNILNPNPEVASTPFRLGDKVINTANGWYPLEKDPPTWDGIQVNQNGEVYVANGEMGRVIFCEPNRMHVELQNPSRTIHVGRRVGAEKDEADGDDDESTSKTNTGCSFELGYAISTHKSQGSQWPVVIVMLDSSGSALRVCSREWLYTAISRAEQCCYLVGQIGVANRYCRNRAIDGRKTFLKERLVDALRSF